MSYIVLPTSSSETDEFRSSSQGRARSLGLREGWYVDYVGETFIGANLTYPNVDKGGVAQISSTAVASTFGYSFAGVGGYIALSSDIDGDAWMVRARLKTPAAVNANTDLRVCMAAVSDVINLWAGVRLQEAGGVDRLQIWSGSGATNTSWTVQLNTWVEFEVEFAGSGNIRAYVNGEFVGAAAIANFGGAAPATAGIVAGNSGAAEAHLWLADKAFCATREPT